MIDPEKEVSGVIYNGVRLTLAGSGESAPFIVKLTESEGDYSVDKTNQEIYDAMLANMRVLITDDLFIMPLIFCQETEAIFACTADLFDGPENVTVIVKTENDEQTVALSNELLSTLEDAPSDGELYARKDGAWSKVESLGYVPINVKDFGAEGDGETDDTDAIQAALEAGHNIVIPDGTYMINVDDNGGLHPQSNSVITLSPNAVLKCFTASTDYYNIVHIDNVSNVVIQGGKIVGDKATHTAVETTTYEFGYGVLIDNSENITLKDMEIVDCIGDGVNVGVEGNEHIIIDNLIIHDCRRQGISVISGDGVIINNCEIYNINGTLPKSGIDIEPDGTRTVSNVTIVDCNIHNTDGASIVVAETVNSITNVSINGGTLEYVQFAGGNNLLMANASAGKITIGNEDVAMINNCNISEIWLNCGNAVFTSCKFISREIKDYFIRVLSDRLSTSKSDRIAFNGCAFDVTNCKHFLFSPFGGASSGIELLEFNNCSANITHNLTSTFATSGFSNRMPHRTVISGSKFVFNSKIYQLFTADALSAENVELEIIDSTIINANEYRTNYLISGTTTYAVWVENSRIVNYINMLYADGASDGEIVLLNNILEMSNPTGKYPTTSDVNIVNITRDNTKYLDGITANVQEQIGDCAQKSDLEDYVSFDDTEEAETLQIDSVVTSGSSNLITSGAVAATGYLTLATLPRYNGEVE